MNAVPELRDRLEAERIHRTWASLVGADVARHARPQGVAANGTLHVVVDNSPWLQELTLRSGEITARIAARFDAIRSLRFTLGRMEQPTEAARPAPPLSPPVLGPEITREIEDTVAPIRDPDVKAAARRLLTAARRSAMSRGAV